MQKRAWLIQCFDGLQLRFSRRLSSALSEREIGALLQRLHSRDLSCNEIVSSSLRKSWNGYSSLLEIRREPRDRVILSVGTNPHYVASQHTEYEFEDISRSM